MQTLDAGLAIENSGIREKMSVIAKFRPISVDFRTLHIQHFV